MPERGRAPIPTSPMSRTSTVLPSLASTTTRAISSSLVWGHPQGPTGLRGVIEMIEELVMKGGGYGLFVGCAAGDSAMAVILEVKDRK